VEVLTKENTSNFSQFWRVVAKYDWVRKHTWHVCFTHRYKYCWFHERSLFSYTFGQNACPTNMKKNTKMGENTFEIFFVRMFNKMILLVVLCYLACIFAIYSVSRILSFIHTFLFSVQNRVFLKFDLV
jgi:hypothetical protein